MCKHTSPTFPQWLPRTASHVQGHIPWTAETYLKQTNNKSVYSAPTNIRQNLEDKKKYEAKKKKKPLTSISIQIRTKPNISPIKNSYLHKKILF
jgi:hypothetical protein